MFTGIVEEIGVIRRVTRAGEVARLEIAARVTIEGGEIGGSVAVNGACLTIVAKDAHGFAFELGPETLARTTLGRLEPGDRVNLERPLRFGGSLGGHLVLGHVDGVATVEGMARVESSARLRVGYDPSLDALMIPQGSVAVDGVSLTVAALGRGWLEVMLIPHTLAVTTLGTVKVGETVNIEADVIGKYVVRSLGSRAAARDPE
ncbi:MAG: riboflavin synthase [Candidatus Rokubacteria bacterium]|nr:riboflavin synthase [Candidatus Rokubacteria bacterium]